MKYTQGVLTLCISIYIVHFLFYEVHFSDCVFQQVGKEKTHTSDSLYSLPLLRRGEFPVHIEELDMEGGSGRVESYKAPFLHPDCGTGLIVPLYDAVSKSLLKDESYPCFGILIRDDLIVTDSKCAETAKTAKISNIENDISLSPILADEDNLINRSRRKGHKSNEMHLRYIRRSNSLPSAPIQVIQLNRPRYRDQFGWPRLRMVLLDDIDNDNFHQQKDHPQSSLSTLILNDLQFTVQCRTKMPPIFSIKNNQGQNIISTLWERNPILKNTIQNMIWTHRDIDMESSFSTFQNQYNELWWTRKYSRKFHLDLIRNEGRKFKDGPPNSLNIWDTMGLGGALEALDPSRLGHRSANCHHIYSHHWKNEQPFSREDYFNWLDYGSGATTNLTECPRETLEEVHTHFFTHKERLQTRAKISIDKNGTLVLLAHPNDTTNKTMAHGKYIYVWGLDRELYVTRENDSNHVHIHGHPSFFSGGSVLAAGELIMGKHGKLKKITPSSGHYKPLVFHMNQLYQYFRHLGATHEAIVWTGQGLFTSKEWTKVYEMTTINESS